jgi:hypothetical protein
MLGHFKLQIEKIIKGYSNLTNGELAIYNKQVTELAGKKDKL